MTARGGSSPRLQRVGAAIQEALSAILREDLHDPRVGFVTVTGVEVTADLQRARVHVSILGDAAHREASLAALVGARGFLRSRLAHVLALRRTPEIEFRLDLSGEQGDRIERLLRHDPGEPGEGGSA
jgi:ribosome-binding factor A